MRIEHETYLDYADILLKPKRSTLFTRNDVDLTREFVFPHSKREWQGIPIIVANMDTTGTFEMVLALSKNQVAVALHKHYPVEELVEFYRSLSAPMRQYVFYSLGIQESDVEKLDAVLDALQSSEILYQLNIDVPNGYLERFPIFISRIRAKYPHFTISAGNVCTAEMTEQLIISGADIVKCGIGSGAACITRSKTGVGIPQFSAIMECADAAHGLNGMLIGDGGITCEGDFSKGFCAGADFLMSGGFFAGHHETAGKLVEREGRLYKEFYGMSSKKANEAYSGGLKDYRASEGRELLIPYRGPVEDTLQEILGGMRSCGTFIGARKLKQFPKCASFVKVNHQLNRVFEKYQ